MGTVAGWIVAVALVALVVWGVRRFKRGVANVQALMARVEAAAEAESFSAAVAANRVDVRIGNGRGADDDDGRYYDDERRSDQYNVIDYDYLASLVASKLGAMGSVAGRAGVRPGAHRVLARDAVRPKGRALREGAGDAAE